MRTYFSFTICLFLVVIAPLSLSENIPIEKFVKQHHFHGIPYKEASSYGSGEAQKLVDILSNEGASSYWANTASTLCIIGDQSNYRDIVEFIERDFNDDYSMEIYRAKKSAIMALGYYINSHGEGNSATEYLAKSLDPDSWVERGVKGLPKGVESFEVRNQEFSKYALLGLALSGTLESERVMQNYKTSVDGAALTSSSHRNFYENVSGELPSLIEENRKIRSQGMLQYNNASSH